MGMIEFERYYRDVAVQLNRIRAPQGTSWQMHTHDFYECFLVESPGGRHCLKSGREPLQCGHLYFVRPEHAHGFASEKESDSPRFVNIVLRADLVNGFMERNPAALPQQVWERGSRQPYHIELAPGQLCEMRRIIEVLLYGNRSPVDAEWFLCSISRTLQPLDPDLGGERLPVWLREGLYQFRQPEHLRQGAPHLVGLCRRSSEHVAREMKKHLGKRPVEWINEQKLRYAAVLLQTTELSITELALEAGMDNLSHFHRLFKNRYGSSPLQFRKRQSESVH